MYDAGAGKLDRRIVIQKPVQIDDGFTIKNGFEDDFSIWAGVSWISDSMKWIAQGANRQSVVRFVVRSSNQTRLLDGTFRIKFEDRVYLIDGIKQFRNGKTHLEITCALGVK